jgi:hypothetical protein
VVVVEYNKIQEEVLRLYTQEFLTIKEIASRRKTTVWAVYDTIRKLTKKGLIKRGGYKLGGVLTPRGLQSATGIPIESWRYHALEFEIKPYYFTEKYYRIIKKKGNRTIPYGNWKASLYYKKIIVWLEAGTDFCFKDKNEAIRQAQDSFNSALIRMQQDLGFYVFKDRKANILLLKQHLANTYAPESEVITEKQMFIQFSGEDDKVWLQYDRSKGIEEREYVHGIRAVDDSDTLEVYLNDFRDNNPLTNSQLTSRVSDIITALEKVKDIIEKKL